MLLLVAPLVFRAPGPAARSPAAESKGRFARTLCLLSGPTGFRAPPGPAARSPLALHVVACGTAGVPGASGPGRPRDRHTRAYGSEWSISKPARALRTLRRPPHRWGRGGLQSGGTWCACTWPGPAAAHGHRGQDYSQPSHNKRSEKPRPLQWLRSSCHGFPTMSHAIPLPLFQTLNSHR